MLHLPRCNIQHKILSLKTRKPAAHCITHLKLKHTTVSNSRVLDNVFILLFTINPKLNSADKNCVIEKQGVQ
jgi:hypothetical protein